MFVNWNNFLYCNVSGLGETVHGYVLIIYTVLSSVALPECSDSATPLRSALQTLRIVRKILARTLALMHSPDLILRVRSVSHTLTSPCYRAVRYILYYYLGLAPSTLKIFESEISVFNLVRTVLQYRLFYLSETEMF